MYFNELSTVIDRNWGDFEKWFGEEKSRVLEWMNHINRSRADAHARTLSEEDLAFLRICFRRLEERLFGRK
jgi:hypothetical protein